MDFRCVKIRKNWPIWTLLALELALFAVNFKPQSFLLGWDNLLPEFNFPLNLTRSLFGVWQEYRGLGLYDGMAHAANLVHTLFLWLMALVLPTNVLRWVFTFLMHGLGGLGMFFLLKHLLSPRSERQIAIFAGALFYLLNLATIQMFYTPLEAFAVHFAALPWLALTLIYYLENGTIPKLALFLDVALLTTPQYFVPTLILPVAVLLTLICGFYLVQNFRQYFKRVGQTALGFALVNAFWLLPYLVGLPQNAAVIASAKINQMASSEILARNRAFGDFKDVMLLRGFSLNYDDLVSGDSFGFMMAPWRQRLFSPTGTILAWGLAGLALLGAIVSLRRSRRQFWPFLGTALFAFFLLGNDIPWLSQLTQQLYERIPFFAEAYRLPFTKFSLLWAASYSVFIALGVEALIAYCARLSPKMAWVPAVLVIGATAYLSLPAWNGNFFYANLRLKLPAEYQELFKFMRQQNPQERVALLPQPAYWSWKFYRWGYRGSGFLWYGLPQPTLDRAFDPWSRENENYYWELSQALYSKDAGAFAKVLTKYQVGFIIVDENLVSASHNRALFNDETTELLQRTTEVKPLANFGNLHVYQHQHSGKSFVEVKAALPRVGPNYLWSDQDKAFQDLDDYTSEQNYDYFYPARSLFTKRAVDEREFKIKETDRLINLSALAGSASREILKEKSLVYDSEREKSLLPELVTTCGLLRSGQIKSESLTDSGGWLRFTTSDQRACLNFSLPTLTHREGYLVVVESRHLTGRPLLFSLISNTAKHVELETYLPTTSEGQTSYFVLPPLSPDGLGYSVYIANDAIGRYPTINDIKSLKFYKLPYQDLVTTREEKIANRELRIANYEFTVSHPHPAYYKVNLQLTTDNPQLTTLILNQSFHPGWRAYQVQSEKCPFTKFRAKSLCEALPMIFGERLTNHVLVNNWANAWLIESKPADQRNNEATIVIFFYPQLWEFLGLALLPLPFLWLWIHRPARPAGRP